MPNWVPEWLKSKNESEEGGNTVTLPKELEDRFKKVDDLDVKMTNMDTKLKSLDSITAFIEEQKEDKKKAKEAAEEAERKRKQKTPEQLQEEDESLAAELLTDPKAAFNKLSGPIRDVVMLTRADNIKREVFVDRAEEFPYYAGDIKKEIDATLEKQDLSFRNNAGSVENVYYTVVGKRQKEIQDGKIKSRFASSSGSLKGSADGKQDEIKIELNDDIRKMMRLTGLSEKDALDMLTKAAAAGEVEYV